MDQQIDESSFYSSEDQDAQLLTDKVQEKILSTVAKLKAHHPSIYNINQSIFQDKDFETTQKKNTHQNKKFTYKNMVFNNENQQNSQSEQLPHALQEKKAKNMFKKAIEKQKQQNQSQLFTVKEKITKNNQNKDKYQELTQKFNPQSSKLIKKVWEDNSKMDQTDLFLKQYILNKKWLSSKYQKELGKNEKQFQQIDDQDQQRSLQIDQYEAKYNFRFQQPQADKIVQYPRKIQDSLRIKPQSRKQKRKKLQERKKEEQLKLKAESNQKKQQLKKEIVKKFFNQNQSAEFQNDWFFCDDCTKAFEEGQIYYRCNQCQDYMLCSDCHDLIIHKHELIKDKIPKGLGAPPQQKRLGILQKLKTCMSCKRKLPQQIKRYEYKDRSFMIQILCQKCYDQSNLQIKKKFKQVKNEIRNVEELLQKDAQKVKQLTNSKEIQQMVDQYIKNDFEDVIGGGFKTKFKYVKVKPQSYGLSDQQILYGEDKQMNNYVSIKKLAPYRQGNLRLRNSVYNKKIKSIEKTVKVNKKLIQKNKGELKIKKRRTIQKIKQRSFALKKKREQKLRILNVSDKNKQKNLYIPSNRLASYGLKVDNFK